MKGFVVPLLATTIVLTLTGAAAIPAHPAPAQPPPPGPDGRAGACFSYYPDTPGSPERPFLPLAVAAGSRWDRFPFDWYRLEPADGEWEPQIVADYDDLVSDLQNADMNMIGILLWTPEWAATSGQGGPPLPGFQQPGDWHAPIPQPLPPYASSAASSPPQGLYEEWDDWSTEDGDPINYWGRFVHAAVSRYSAQVQYWEVWNEPEWVFWSGTEADYARLLQVGYRAIKDACPGCSVLFAGLHYWADPTFYERVLDILNDEPDAAAHDYFFDVMSVHFYSRPSSVLDQVNAIRNGMSAHVSPHPIWLTETGVPVWDDAVVDPDPTRYDFAATQEEAAAYVLQSYAYAWAADVERYLFFRTSDADMGEYFGLLRNDLSPRPAYTAYQVAATYMVSPTLVTHWDYGGGASRVTLWGTPYGKVSVIWNRTPTTITFSYSATLPTALRIDQHHQTTTLTATAGAYSLTLPGASACITIPGGSHDYFIGGAPYLVVEADTTPPVATALPLPPSIYARNFWVAWEGSDDEAGVWGYSAQVQEERGGAWQDWIAFTAAASALFTGGRNGTQYCFRVRAWDRAGNRGDWPSDAQACTTVSLEHEVLLPIVRQQLP
ncbi:MAG: hypothetical protein JW900_10950 [Anaerolineae bacterium]|nr:hypothetical protein [Anaerolineae bacterium]